MRTTILRLLMVVALTEAVVVASILLSFVPGDGIVFNDIDIPLTWLILPPTSALLFYFVLSIIERPSDKWQIMIAIHMAIVLHIIATLPLFLYDAAIVDTTCVLLLIDFAPALFRIGFVSSLHLYAMSTFPVLLLGLSYGREMDFFIVIIVACCVLYVRRSDDMVQRDYFVLQPKRTGNENDAIEQIISDMSVDEKSKDWIMTEYVSASRFRYGKNPSVMRSVSEFVGTRYALPGHKRLPFTVPETPVAKRSSSDVDSHLMNVSLLRAVVNGDQKIMDSVLHIWDVPLENLAGVSFKFLVEDVSGPQYPRELSSIEMMSFDVLSFSKMMDNRDVLLTVALHILNCSGLGATFLHECGTDSVNRMVGFLRCVEGCYSDSNAYHNVKHAADVTACAMTLLRASSLWEVCAPWEKVAVLVACVCLDIHHPGRTNAFLNVAQDPLAVIYNGRSPLENHHAALTFALLSIDEFNFAQDWFSPSVFARFKELVIKLIMATDMARHFDYMALTQKLRSDDVRTMSMNDDARHLLLELLVKVGNVFVSMS